MTRTSLVAAAVLMALVALGSPSSNGIASRGPVSVSALAPADEYFGRQHLSPLGIRHKIFSLKDDLHHARSRPDAIAHDTAYVEDALQDWLGRFPRDPWIPATAWNLATLYEELPGVDAQQHAIALLRLLRERFTDSAFAGYAARDLSRGIGVRAWPQWAGTPQPDVAPAGADALVQAILNAARGNDSERGLLDAQSLEDRYRALSREGSDPAYARAAWELAALYERLPGEDARRRSIRLLALLVDRFPTAIYGRWALRDLERGLGTRT